MAAEKRAAKNEEMRTRLRVGMESGSLENVPHISLARKWIYARSLGGGMAVAALWVQLDSNNVVRDRVVRKDTQMREEDWQGEKYWHVDSENPAYREPLEHYTQRLLQGSTDAPNRSIVQVRNCELDDANRIYRLYTDYCPNGDLNNLIVQNNHNITRIPEAWVWMAFSELVDAALAMEKGNGKEPAMQVVHRDLKPQNIFLDLPSTDSWPRYPQPRVGDFGLAVVTSPNDKDNPRRWGLAGTQNYHAPEQVDLGQQKRPDYLSQLLAWTNVWGIGMIMLDIVNHTSHLAPKVPLYAAGRCHPESFEDDVRAHYSGTLLRTIMSCLTIQVTKRPKLAHLRIAIDAVMSESPMVMSEVSKSLRAYMQDARKGIQKEDPQYELHGLPDEQYKVDMAFQNLRSAKSGAAAPVGNGAEESYR